jgi:7,8-dihydropterin-6-yl-methyl-4-(beta-D-ribofuranosyl)aminobenzene 5'-phosphate synthase
MSAIEDFGSTKDVKVTVLVDNMTDMLLKSTDTVIRYTQESGEPLLAEHGLSALIELGEVDIHILWDAGITDLTLIENMRRMKVDTSSIDKIALSHGHPDHIMAMTDVVEMVAGTPPPKNWDDKAKPDEMRSWMKSLRVPLIAHPAAFRERWKKFPDGNKYGPMITPRDEWEAAGAEIILSEGPYQLGPGCWLTGAVPRKSFEKAGTPPIFAYRDGDEFVRDYVDDDQAIIINVEGKGLVVVAGCAHAGILNTVNYAREISGVDKVWGILGGFHLISSTEEEIQMTIDEIKTMEPEIIVPTHCTGFTAIRMFADQMPESFVLGVVGTSYLF